MATFRETLWVETRKELDIVDLTARVAGVINESGIRDGIACVFTPHSTAAVMANEWERGLTETDVPAALERLVPRAGSYAHNRTGDPNGHAHVRAALLGPSVTFPIAGGKPVLGRWQQILLVELDLQSRRREVVVQIVGDGSGQPLNQAGR